MQALQLMNDVQHVEAARAFAQRMLTEGGQNPRDRLTWAWLSVTSRPPTNFELGVIEAALKENLARFSDKPDEASKLVEFGESKPDEELSKQELAADTLVANLLLNLDECVTKN